MSDCYPPLPVYPDVSINIPPVDTTPPNDCPVYRMNPPTSYKDATNRQPPVDDLTLVELEPTDEDVIIDEEGNLVYTGNNDECNECLHGRYIYPYKDTIMIRIFYDNNETRPPLLFHWTTNREYTIEPGMFSQFQTFNNTSLPNGKYDYLAKFKLHSNPHLKAAHWLDKQDGDEDY